MKDDIPLTNEAKSLIRKYMLIIVIPSASALTIGGIVFGWLLNEGIRASAYAKAYDGAQGKIIDLATSAASSANEAEASSNSAENTLQSISAARLELENSFLVIKEIVDKAKSNQKTLELIADAEHDLARNVAEVLLENPDKLSSTVAGNIGQKVDALQKELSQRFRFLESTNYKILWEQSGGPGPTVQDFSRIIPEKATAAILNVIVSSSANGGTGSFVCSGPDGKFASDMWHYNNISVTEYGEPWSGGVVICPLSQSRTITWGMFDNTAKGQPVKDRVYSIGTLVGWL